MEFMGYKRPDGSVGIRNHVLIMPTVNCANSAAKKISNAVKGTTWFEHQHGCGQLSPDAEQTARAFIGHGTHPNVYGVVVVGLGCEVVRAQDIAVAIKKECPYKPVECIIIQDTGLLDAISRGSMIAQKMVTDASLLQREPIDIAELILGTECGGSDTCSGISANPALGMASDLLIDLGGKSILAEVPELFGAENILARRAVNNSVRTSFWEVIKRFESNAKSAGFDMRAGNPPPISPGNMEGGLSSIEEKSLGCVHKAGTRPLKDVIEWGEKVRTKGLTLMNTPGHDLEELTGLVAGGCHIVVFTTGRGTPVGSAIVPTIKVSSNTALFLKMSESIDLNAGTIITGDERVEIVGRHILEEMISVASGKLTKAEVLGQNDFAINRVYLTL